jgi:hypothetical protein
VAQDKVRIDNPTQNLESYFLEVVARAKQSATETSGATSGGRVAAYLRGDGEGRPSADKLLERLTLPSAPAAAAAPVAAPAVDPVDRARLESLTRPSEPAAPPATPAPGPDAPAPAVDLSKANAKLSGLLNKPK